MDLLFIESIKRVLKVVFSIDAISNIDINNLKLLHVFLIFPFDSRILLLKVG